jgi:hypothetical protein
VSLKPSRWVLTPALIVAAAISTCPASGAAELDALQLAARNTAAIEALLPFSCSVEIDHLEETLLGRYTTATYQRSQESIRVKFTLGAMKCDTLIKDGQTRRYSVDTAKSGDGGRVGTVIGDTNTLVVDVWRYGLATHADGVTFQSHTVESLVKRSKKPRARSEAVSGRNLIRLDIPTETTDFIFWLDPAANYWVYKSEVTAKGSKTFGSAVEGFTEVVPGIHFPSVCRRTTLKPGAAPTGWVAKFTKVTAGKPLPADAFAFRFPAGVLVIDEIANTLNRTDPAGDARLPAKNARGEPMYSSKGLPPSISLDRTAAVEQASVPQQATQVEPTPRSQWLLPAGIAFLALGLTLWLARRVCQNRLEK